MSWSDLSGLTFKPDYPGDLRPGGLIKPYSSTTITICMKQYISRGLGAAYYLTIELGHFLSTANCIVRLSSKEVCVMFRCCSLFAGFSCLVLLLTLDTATTHGEDWTPLWSTANLSQPRYALAATAVGNKALFAGGETTDYEKSNVVDIYDTTTSTWSTYTLTQARRLLGSASAGDKAFFAGGNNSGGFSDVVDIYDAVADSWSTSSLSQARMSVSGTSAGMTVYFAGGRAGTFPSNSSVVDIYDITSNTWSTDNLSVAREAVSAVSVNDKLVFAGGWISGPNTYQTLVPISKIVKH